jgi:hypothetical protein
MHACTHICSSRRFPRLRRGVFGCAEGGHGFLLRVVVDTRDREHIGCCRHSPFRHRGIAEDGSGTMAEGVAIVGASDASVKPDRLRPQYLAAHSALWVVGYRTSVSHPIFEAGGVIWLDRATPGMGELAGICLQLHLLDLQHPVAEWPSNVRPGGFDFEEETVVLLRCDLYCDNLPMVEAFLDDSDSSSRGDVHLAPLTQLCSVMRMQLLQRGIGVRLRRPERGRNAATIVYCDGLAQGLRLAAWRGLRRAEWQAVQFPPALQTALRQASASLMSFDAEQLSRSQ